MGKKGKGRGRGRGTPADSAPGQQAERRPGVEQGSGRGHVRGRGAEPSAQRTAPQASGPARGAEPSAQRTAPQAWGPTRGSAAEGAAAPVKKPDVQVPKFFEKEATSVTEASTSHKEPKVSIEETRGTRRDVAHGEVLDTGAAEMKPAASCRRKKTDKADQEALLSGMAGLSLKYDEPIKFAMAKRPDYGKLGEHIPLFVNYFKLSFKDTVVYHYDIDILDSTKENKSGKSVFSQERTLKEDIEKNVRHIERQKRRNMGKAKCRLVVSKLFESTEALKKFCPVYDGQKNLFTSRALPCKEKTQFPVDVTVEERLKRFFVAITPVKKKDQTNIISLEPLKEMLEKRSSDIPTEVLLVFETVMNHRDPPFNQVHFRNSFYYLGRENKSYLGYGMDIVRGHFQSIQITKSGPVVVINLRAKAFHQEGPVLDYATDVLKTDITSIPRLRPFEIKNLSDALKGVQVQVTHQRQRRKYKIKGLTDKPASEIVLDFNKRKISVAQYFLEKYNCRLKYPFLPCLHMHSNNNSTFIPMETCEVTPGQPKVGKLSAELTSTMIRSTAVEPKRRKESILRTAADVSKVSDKYMKAFGLFMDIKLMQVNGRIIAAPKLVYDGPEASRIANPDVKGVWRVEGGKKFVKAVKISKWVLISFADRRRFGSEILEKYCQFLVQSARKCGMALDRPQSIEIHGREITTEKVLEKVKKSGAEMAIVVLNRRDAHHTYDEVKFLADFKYNLVTQCMEDKTLARINDQITTNVCLKINVKLGGINHTLLQKHKVFFEPVTVLGIDAIHWTRGYGYPSIVSVVGSLNPTATRYALACDLQSNDREGKISQEIIRDMKKISMVILEKFKEANNGRRPDRIIVFRDGVSDGQFQHALDHEVSGLQEACKELFGEILRITYLVVQKRHHTRFFPVRPQQGVGKNLNVPPGTCVDQEITHPVYFDYFICSHEGIQGTSKAAHYTILHDDNKFTSDELQQLCYFLCHTYVRCTRSVSLPAPVMYADLAAARAKKYADLFIQSDTASSVGSDSVQRNLPPRVEQAIRGMQSFDNNMFYV